MTALRRNDHEMKALRFLASCGGGFTAGHIARECGWNGRSEMAVFRTSVIDLLYRLELIDKIDREKPAVYVITDAGRSILNDPERTETVMKPTAKLLSEDDLQALVGRVVEFGETIVDWEGYPEKGMRAHVVQVDFDDAEDPDEVCHRIHLDFGRFDGANRAFESSNYFDKSGAPSLTAREAGYYSVKDELLVGSRPERLPFVITDDETLGEAALARSVERAATLRECAVIAEKRGSAGLAETFRSMILEVEPAAIEEDGSCAYPDCDCAVSFPEGYRPSVATQCPSAVDDDEAVRLDALMIEWFSHRFGVPLGDMPGLQDVEAMVSRVMNTRAAT